LRLNLFLCACCWRRSLLSQSDSSLDEYECFDWYGLIISVSLYRECTYNAVICRINIVY
jgi:hypothetical protein